MSKQRILISIFALCSVWPFLYMHKGQANSTYEVTTQVFEPSYEEFDLDMYDQRAFRIAEILQNRNISGDSEELLNLSQLILDKSEEIGVTPSVILAIIDVESTFRPCAISHVGAKGLMQVMPERILQPEMYDEQYAFDHHLFYEPEWNIEFGADYLGYLIKRFGSVDHALAAYNAGPTRFQRARGYAGKGYAKKVLSKVEHFDAAL